MSKHHSYYGGKTLTLGDLVNVLIASNKLRRDRNDRGRLNLVSGEHPDLDACVPKQLECPADVVLQLVLDACQPEQLEVPLKRVGDNSRHRLIATLDPHARSVVARLEILIGGLGKLAPTDDEGTQAFTRHVGRLFLEPVIALHDPRHDDIGTLLKEGELAGGGIAHDDAHSFGLGCKGEDLEDVVGEGTTRRRAELDPRAVAECEGQTDGRGPLDDGDFVR